jgi:hypothetical protein
MNDQLLEFECWLARRSTEACKVLCIPYSTYANKRATRAPLPPLIAGHIETLKRLKPGALNTLVRERLGLSDGGQ